MTDQRNPTRALEIFAYELVYPLEQDALERMAYYFTFEYVDSRDVDDYTAPVRREIEQWRIAYESSGLFTLHDGIELKIVDIRPVARSPLLVLRGIRRLLYLHCDHVRSVESLQHQELAATPQEIDESLAFFIERGIMIRDDNHVLSLAVHATNDRGPTGFPHRTTKTRRAVFR